MLSGICDGPGYRRWSSRWSPRAGNKRPVNIMPVGLYCGGRGTYGYCEQFMPIGLYVRRHGHKLHRVQSRRVMHNVRPSGCIVYRRHRHIWIRTTLRHGIIRDTQPPECPPPTQAPRKHSLRGWFQGGGCRASRDGGWGTMTTPPRNKVPLCGGVARSAGVVYSLLVTRDSLFVCVSLGRVAPCAYPRICSNCAVACFHILGFIASKAWRSSK